MRSAAPITLHPVEDATPTAAGPASSKTSRRPRKSRPESQQSLQVYSVLIGQARPLTVRELIDATGVADGTLYPILQKRVAAGLLEDAMRDGVATYDLTEQGYVHARDILTKLERPTADWVRAEHRYAPKTSARRRRAH